MTKELELKLVEKYPEILREYGGNIQETCMHWGFEHDDGWFKILDEGFEKIAYLVAAFNHDSSTDIQFVVKQVKEKFAHLTIYYEITGGIEIEKNILRDIVIQMEEKSKHTCEITGKCGKFRPDLRWKRTLCDEEYEKILLQCKIK